MKLLLFTAIVVFTLLFIAFIKMNNNLGEYYSQGELMVINPDKIPVNPNAKGGKKATPSPQPTPTVTPVPTSTPTPTVTPIPLPSYDLDNDGDIDADDYVIFKVLFVQQDLKVDYNQDNMVTVLDYNMFKEAVLQ